MQVPNGHEDDELTDGEVMNYMCHDDEVKSICLAIQKQSITLISRLVLCLHVFGF